MKLRTLAVAVLALAACGDRAEETAPAVDSATTATPGYDPDTTMAPPPGMDTAMAAPVDSVSDTTGVAPTDSTRP